MNHQSSVLVTGACGYIGSVTVDHLLHAGYQVTGLDNLSSGKTEALPEGATFLEMAIDDPQLAEHLKDHHYDAVIHFASKIQAGESMEKPFEYFRANTFATLNFFNMLVDAGIKNIILSSTAAVYATKDTPIEETDTIDPANVYGESKRMIERILHWLKETKGINYTCLRYFNASGASVAFSDIPQRGESHQPETHLIPLVLEVALGKRDKISVFGSDYETPDGTNVRDYIHVDDLATAHLLALESMLNGSLESGVFNVGTGEGFSNLQVIETAREVTGHAIPVEMGSRRTGDAPSLVAASQKLQETLGWKPKYSDIRTIIESAWKWHSK